MTSMRVEFLSILSAKFTIDELDLQKFFYKVALGFGYYIIGESFSRHSDADKMRQFIWEPERVKAMAMHRPGSFWPRQINSCADTLGIKDYHVLSLVNSGPLSFSALLFGKYGCTIQLCDDGLSFQEKVPRGDGVVVWINPASGVMNKDSLRNYLELRPQLRV